MVDSPCKNICKIDKKSGLCYGCFRTQQEINNWIVLKEEEEKKIIISLKNRSQTLRD